MHGALTNAASSPLPVLLVILLAMLPARGTPPEAYASPEGSGLHELNSVKQFSALFQQEQGRPRLVLLLSPT